VIFLAEGFLDLVNLDRRIRASRSAEIRDEVGERPRMERAMEREKDMGGSFEGGDEVQGVNFLWGNCTRFQPLCQVTWSFGESTCGKVENLET